MWVIAALGGCGGDDDGRPHRPDETGDTGTPPGTTTEEWPCVITEPDPDAAHQLGCSSDFDALASEPLDASIPGARSTKTIVDRQSANALWFIDAIKFPIHWDFCSQHLSVADGFPPVADLGGFNLTEYYSPDRRFVLGAVTYYEGPGEWVYEIAPYDTADAAMVELAFDTIRDNAWFGPKLKFHATSETVAQVVPTLPADIPIIETEELFAGIAYQPYNFGTTTGLLTFRTAEEVDGAYLNYRELVVLDAIPNDISIVAGIVTAEFQTPLAHINVLSVNRGTPNMALRDGFQDPELRALEGKWVELTVGPFDYEVHEITAEEAEIWWEENRPDPLTVPQIDGTIADLRDMEDIVVDGNDLATEVETAIRAFGSKGTNYAALFDIGGPVRMQADGFVIPFHHYQRHMDANGLRSRLERMLGSADWSDPNHRQRALEDFKVAIVEAPLDPLFLDEVLAKVAADFPADTEVRFRSSTNAEDLGTFTGAGIYNSQTGDPALGTSDEVGSVAWAIKEAWANLWNPRAYEERGYYGIDQLAVGMALLTTPNFPDEEANGVAVTNNLFDVSGYEPAFYVNVQIEDYEVVQPEPGVLSDTFLYYYYTPGQPVVYVSHSNLVLPGESVLSNVQIHDLGEALAAIHSTFSPVYNTGAWYGMDVEFKFDDKDSPGDPRLYIKQARPFPWSPGSSGAQ